MTSIFLAKAMGIYMMISALAYAIRRDELIHMINTFRNERNLVLVTGAFTLILGTILVLSHGMWYSDWRAVITVIAWITLIKGFFIQVMPTQIMKVSHWFSSKTVLAMFALLWFFLGAFLAYQGFWSPQ